jgi:tripartite ATP-independent transporter DctM subunit
MRAAGYDHGYATALVACSSVLALLIPPSIPMIVFCMTSGVSVSAAFLSTVVPGVLIGLVYILMNRFYAARLETVKAESLQSAKRLTIAQVIDAAPALLMPVLMLGGIYTGAFTPTEAAAVALVYAIGIGFLIYRTLTWRTFAATLAESSSVTASIIAILFFLLIFGQLLSLEGIPKSIADAITSVTSNYYLVLLAINVVLFIIGMIIDDISGSILAAVILLPVATSVGVDPLHFAAIVGTNLGLGNITPPTAPLLFVASSISRLDLREFATPAVRFMLFGHLPVVALVTYVPGFATALPGWLLAN